MIIQCTKTLLDKLGIKGSELVPAEGYEEFPNSMMAWHANLISIGRKKAVVLMNNESRYPVVIYSVRTKDFSRIKELIREAIAQALRMEGVRPEVVDTYFAKAGEITFSKTANRSMITRLNHAVLEVEQMNDYLDIETNIQRYISLVSGRCIQGSGANNGFYPYEKMLTGLSVMYNGQESATMEEILDIELYQLKIQLKLEGHDIWRRVLVPAIFSFRHLHNIIQTVFDWQNYHLHEFEAKREGNKPIQILMDDDPETMEFVNPDKYDIKQERLLALEEIFPKYHEVLYTYDFGDSWEHIITLEKVSKSKTLQATYIDGNGERPPEDVGGLGGYEQYLEVINNEHHPNYQDMKMWAESQKERKLSHEKINQRLKNIIVYGFTFSVF